MSNEEYSLMEKLLSRIVLSGTVLLIISAIGMTISAVGLGKYHSITTLFAVTAASMYFVIFVPAFALLIQQYFTTSKSMTQLLSVEEGDMC